MIRYHVQTYTCENNSIAKIIIPESATKDDLIGFRELIDVMIERKFKVKGKKND